MLPAVPPLNPPQLFDLFFDVHIYSQNYFSHSYVSGLLMSMLTFVKFHFNNKTKLLIYIFKIIDAEGKQQQEVILFSSYR